MQALRRRPGVAVGDGLAQHFQFALALGGAQARHLLIGTSYRELGVPAAQLIVVGAPAITVAPSAQAAAEGPDRTITEMDKIWEEEQVTFLANQSPDGGCGANGATRVPAQPVAFVPPRNVHAPAPRAAH